MAEPLQIPDKPFYDETLETQLQLTAHSVRLMIEGMPALRETFEAGITGYAWYYYNDESRRIYDAMALVEHDLLLLIQQLLRLRRANLDCYNSSGG